MGHVHRVVAACCLLLAACTDRSGSLPPSAAASDYAYRPSRPPWTHVLPEGWRVSVYRSPPDPSLIAGLLSTYITNTEQAFDDHSPSFGHSGASDMFGEAAVVVEITTLIEPPEESLSWRPSSKRSITTRGPTAWSKDRANQGWVYRWREVCRGQNTCVAVSEWHGPEASLLSVALGERIASSVVLRKVWRDA